jgi:hypothetical protein
LIADGRFPSTTTSPSIARSDPLGGGRQAPARIDPRRFTSDASCHAYEAMKIGTAGGKIVVDAESITSPK